MSLCGLLPLTHDKCYLRDVQREYYGIFRASEVLGDKNVRHGNNTLTEEPVLEWTKYVKSKF